MPIKVKWEEGGVHFECTGIVSKEELYHAVIKNFYDIEASICVKYEIFDCSSAEALHASDRDALIFAGYDIGRSMSAQNANRVKIAFIGDKESITNLFRVYIDACEKKNKKWLFGLFKTVDEARKWIAS